MRKLVKPAGRFWVDILAGQNDTALRCYREYGGLVVSSREKDSSRFVDESVLGGPEDGVIRRWDAVEREGVGESESEGGEG